jgi:hypothetical protein
MKSFSFRVPSLLIGMLFFLTACNNSSDNQSDANASTDSAAGSSSEATNAPVNTIVTQPQHMMVARHKVKDFDAWLQSYDAHDSLRVANGMHSYVISRGLEDPNMVLVAVKADDMAKAKAFSKNPALKTAMQKGGVTGAPDIDFVTITFQDTVQVGTALRSLTTFKVKDWAEWEKNFKLGEQERINNGITVRQYGHDADDNNKISLVTALVDTTKAKAYWKSDELKQRRAAGGVIGEPERFLFRIVKRY